MVVRNEGIVTHDGSPSIRNMTLATEPIGSTARFAFATSRPRIEARAMESNQLGV